ncbi:sensor histidine kinase [Amaricoccus tamworthensis]|uniref:sensor histidine kinase n=1 Tax=Amaricoccus tamworthensis TaxID=57002 RepID=UPI003C7A7E96
MSVHEESLDLALDFAGLGRWEYDPATKKQVLDRRCRMLFEVSEAEAQEFDNTFALVHPDDQEDLKRGVAAILTEGQEFHHRFRVRRKAGGYKWLRGMGRLVNNGGRPKLIGVSLDVTVEEELLRERELHLAEMNHRIKNMFAIVSAMISNANRESETREDMVSNLRGRVSALDRAHSLMLRTDVTQPVGLRQVLECILAPARGGQEISLEGDDVMIPTRLLIPLVLIVHEWVTNSAKYGALHGDDGVIEVRWSSDGGFVRVIWREKVEVHDPNPEPGFGSRLIQASLLQLGAEKTRNYADGWLTIDMTLPLCEGVEAV